MAADITVGILVMLKSGGPDMTVDSIQPEEGWAMCSWLEGSKPMKQAFQLTSLKPSGVTLQPHMRGETGPGR
jgi:uncharacterized protein YodC (DUF2158 family)